MTETLTQGELALARHNGYSLLSQLFLEGVSAETQPYIAAIPELEYNFTNLDLAAAAYQELFGFNLFPHESVFLGTDGLLGGEISSAVQQMCEQAGYAPPENADHIGSELGLLAWLAGAESDAWADNATAIALQLQNRQYVFLESHLLRWLPALVVAIQNHDDAFFAQAAVVTWQLVGAHFDALHRQRAIPTVTPLADPPDLLNNPDTTLKAFARLFTTPAHCGVWIGRHELATLARNVGVPRGFGGRLDMFMNLFRSAVQFDEAEEVFGELLSLAESRAKAYEQLGQLAPTTVPFIDTWRKRALKSAETLSTVLPQIQQTLAQDNS